MVARNVATLTEFSYGSENSLAGDGGRILGALADLSVSYLLDLSLSWGPEMDAEKVEGGQESIQALRKHVKNTNACSLHPILI